MSFSREEWEDALFAAVPDEVVQDQLNDYVLSLEWEVAKLRELVEDMWQLIEDLDETPYVTVEEGNNPAVSWLVDDWSVHDSCRSRMCELGIEVDG